MARKEKIKKPEQPKPRYVMPEPNSDLAAFGWDMGRMRYPSKDSTKNDVWPGRNMFEIAGAEKLKDLYGFDIYFICPKYVQFMFDQSPEIRAGAEKVRAANYTQAALTDFAAVVRKVFKTVVVPEMIRQFEVVGGDVARFYAARLAHIDKFGAGDQIEASTTKSRR
jgi:hypothetical protein